MKNITKKIAIIFIALMIPFKAHALIIDLPEIVLEIINVVTEKIVLVNDKYQSFQKLQSDIKNGVKGSATYKLFTQVQRAYNTVDDSIEGVQDAYNISVFHGFYEVLNSAEIISEIDVKFKVKENYVKKTGDGNDTAQLAEQRELLNETAKNNISTLYAKALSVRYKTELESKQPEDSDYNFSDKMEVLYAIRLVSVETLKRKANVLEMEAGLLEHYGQSALETMAIIKPEDLDSTPEQIIRSEEFEDE